jgi:hypothetical protein
MTDEDVREVKVLTETMCNDDDLGHGDKVEILEGWISKLNAAIPSGILTEDQLRNVSGLVTYLKGRKDEPERTTGEE